MLVNVIKGSKFIIYDFFSTFFLHSSSSSHSLQHLRVKEKPTTRKISSCVQCKLSKEKGYLANYPNPSFVKPSCISWCVKFDLCFAWKEWFPFIKCYNFIEFAMQGNLWYFNKVYLTIVCLHNQTLM
jgi:hypothetical protein